MNDEWPVVTPQPDSDMRYRDTAGPRVCLRYRIPRLTLLAEAFATVALSINHKVLAAKAASCAFIFFEQVVPSSPVIGRHMYLLHFTARQPHG